jgi:RsiW-degrading membrane proteinase PrsW (M82 family)
MDSILLNIFLAILPGTIWLFYFLKNDVRPEPNRQILKIFLLGFLASIPTALLELVMTNWLALAPLSDQAFFLIKYILVIGLIEELFKYFVVRFGILRTSEIDEPIDIPLYMVISALGFATAENVIVFLTQASPLLSDHLLLSFSRFIGATLLHALCSGVIGYFIATAYCGNKRWKNFKILFGMAFAVILHGLFDFFLESSIIKAMDNGWGSSVLYSFLILVVLFVFLSIGFKRIKKLKGACKI